MRPRNLPVYNMNRGNFIPRFPQQSYYQRPPNQSPNPSVLYCIFRGYVFGPLPLKNNVQVGLKLRLIRDLSHKSDRRSVKACLFAKGDQIGHCDVMTRDVLCDLLNGKSPFRAEASVCDFDEEMPDPPEGQFVAMVKVCLIGPLFSLNSVVPFINTRIKEEQIDLHFYKCHPLFRVKTLEMIEEELYADIFVRQKAESMGISRRVNDGDPMNLEDVSGDFRNVFSEASAMEEVTPEEPNELMKTRLLLHQKVGLGWMIKREQKRKDKSLFWKKIEGESGNEYWQNELTGVKTTKAPEEFRGGILADEMGLGKTIQMISLIASSDFGYGPTLIVCPVSVMNTWKYQIEEHVETDAFKVVIYHGSDRNTDKEELEDFDVVITSYSVISFEFSMFGSADAENTAKEEGERSDCNDQKSEFVYTKGVHSVNWFRVVLDEAHKIRSRKSKQHKAICSLETDRRWCLTGTPVQNRLDDLYALICFMRVHPLINIKFWKSIILDPLKLQNPEGLKRLWTLREYILLRRTKTSKIDGKPIVSLPQKICHDLLLEFGEEDAKLYKQLAETGQKTITRLEQSTSKTNVFIFAILTRLRQFCCHSRLVPDDYLEKTRNEANVPADYNSLEEVYEDLLDEEAICVICKDVAENPRVTSCFHVVCNGCLMEEDCPICNKKITLLKEISSESKPNSKGRLQSKRIRELLQTGRICCSAKIERLLKELKSNPFDKNGKKDKSVIFSQWVTMLDIMEFFLRRDGIVSVRIDGRKTAQARDLAYRSFQSNEDVDVILVSLGAGGEGINLTAANRVFLMDPWWNPAAEDQAIDRVHRLGQDRDVQVNRMFMKGTIEEKVKDLQQKKRQLVESTLTNDKNVSNRRVMLSEIKGLFK